MHAVFAEATNTRRIESQKKKSYAKKKNENVGMKKEQPT